MFLDDHGIRVFDINTDKSYYVITADASELGLKAKEMLFKTNGELQFISTSNKVYKPYV